MDNKNSDQIERKNRLLNKIEQYREKFVTKASEFNLEEKKMPKMMKKENDFIGENAPNINQIKKEKSEKAHANVPESANFSWEDGLNKSGSNESDRSI